MKKTIIALAAVLMLAPIVGAVNASTQDEKTEQTENKKDKKDKKDKKKKKKDKKQRSLAEVLADLQALEWNKPAKSGLDVDKWYDEADEFFALVKGIEDNVPLFTICKVSSPDGTTIIAPVDKNGTIRHRNEAFEQVALGVLYGTNVALQATNLGLGTATYAVQIAQDAIPMVGDSARKKANVQIAKAVKAIPLLKEIVTTQNNMMNKYKEMNFNLSSGDIDVTAMAELNIDPENTLSMTDEDMNAFLADEEAAGN